tara:strand:+ start:4348 stop:4524 length:177 start_codon:yes stop_codon:yes gene_type:complete
MVELSVADYGHVFAWFELAFAKRDKSDIPIEDKRLFWKLTFLAEDKMEEEKKELDDIN